MIDKNVTITEIRIKLIRNLKGLTQSELAKKLNVTQALVTSWENGYANISLRQLVKLSYFYKVPIDYFLGLTTEFKKEDYKFKKDLDLKLLGKNIRIIRKIANLTQNEFSKKIHTNYSSISYYESGKMMMSSADLKDICDTFGYSADWCLGNTSKCIRRDKKIKLEESEILQYLEI